MYIYPFLRLSETHDGGPNRGHGAGGLSLSEMVSIGTYRAVTAVERVIDRLSHSASR